VTRRREAIELRLATGLLLALFASGEAAHVRANALTRPAWHSEPGWIAVDDMQFRGQRAEHDCGPTALHMVFDPFCAGEPADDAAVFGQDRRVTAGELRNRARKLGFEAFVVSGTFSDIEHELRRNRPVIVGIAKPSAHGKAIAHYEVVIGIHPKDNRIATLDPASGLRQTTFAGFLEQWTPTKHLLLVLLPTQRTDPCSARAAASTGTASVVNSGLTLATVHNAFSRRSGR
jgi:hypothetical protein